MHFLLNKDLKPLEVQDIDPNTTLLQFLRSQELVGTKEGCASGDCGSCVAVVGELSDNNNINYKSINACIYLLGSLAGKHLITIEGLQTGTKLHPVQSAMVTCHGSQCGFCTPGFVMSLFALYKIEESINLPLIKEYLSGNLCRCTGYKPIVEAAFLAFSKKNIFIDYYQKNTNKIKNILKKIKSTSKTLRFTNNNKIIRYDSPKTTEELTILLNNNQQARLVAGGSDLVLDITQKCQTFNHLIDLKNIKQLQQINLSKNTIEICAAVNFEQALPILIANYPSLKHFLLRFASKPIRNLASICANIANASPIGDMPPVLIALGAKLSLVKLKEVRDLDIENFFISYKKTALRPGEFIASVIMPKLKTNEKLLVYKISKRFEDDISTVCLAIKLNYKNINDNTPKSASIAFGGMAEIPKRVKKLEKTLIKNWNSPNLTSEALIVLKSEFTPFSDVRGSADYRLKLAANLIKKCVLQLENKTLASIEQFSDTGIKKLKN